MNSLIKIDSKGNRKKTVRHRAIVTNGTARTVCNRTIKSYWEAEQVSYFYDTGNRYSHPCRTCLPEDYAKYQAAA